MTEFDLIANIINSPFLIILLSAQGFVLLLIMLLRFGKSYVAATNRQAAAMEKMVETLPAVVGGVNILQDATNRQNEFTQEMRMSLGTLAQEIRNMSDKIERMNERMNK